MKAPNLYCDQEGFRWSDFGLLPVFAVLWHCILVQCSTDPGLKTHYAFCALWAFVGTACVAWTLGWLFTTPVWRYNVSVSFPLSCKLSVEECIQCIHCIHIQHSAWPTEAFHTLPLSWRICVTSFMEGEHSLVALLRSVDMDARTVNSFPPWPPLNHWGLSTLFI